MQKLSEHVKTLLERYSSSEGSNVVRFEDENFRPQFAGHETFPLRSLWLKKAYDAVKSRKERNIFGSPEAIVLFGVGRNMAHSMRHWALAAGIIEERNGALVPTKLGDLLFSEGGYDPYLEKPATLWLVHAALAGTPEHSTTWFWAFNIFSSLAFDRDTLVRGLLDLAEQRDWKRVAQITLKRDVECFVRTYAGTTRGVSVEDALEPLLVELGLIRAAPNGGGFEFVRGPKPSLPDEIFVLALQRFWNVRHQEAETLSVEAICFGMGAPGRVFKLDEEAVIERLARIEEASSGGYLWSETAGLKQVVKRKGLNPQTLLAATYRKERERAA